MSPHFHLAVLTLHGVLATTPPKKSSSLVSFLPIILIFAVLYFVLIRPQRNRTRRHQSEQSSIEVGDEVSLTSGIIGRVTEMTGDRAHVEIAPGIEIEVLRPALGRRVPEPVSDDDIAVNDGDEPGEEPGDEPEEDHGDLGSHEGEDKEQR
ncbi:MAG: preprotein translocase subunit YajC [Acidimicrobiales bacterium]